MIEWTDQSIEELPLVHIDGTMNIADLLTKHHDISVSNLGPDSEWHKGMDWMTLPVEKMPIMRYKQLKVEPSKRKEIDLECFQEPFQQQQPPQDQVPHFPDEVVLDTYHILCHGIAPNMAPPQRTFCPWDIWVVLPIIWPPQG
jgi:hypothetical protein